MCNLQPWVLRVCEHVRIFTCACSSRAHLPSFVVRLASCLNSMALISAVQVKGLYSQTFFVHFLRNICATHCSEFRRAWVEARATLLRWLDLIVTLGSQESRKMYKKLWRHTWSNVRKILPFFSQYYWKLKKYTKLSLR